MRRMPPLLSAFAALVFLAQECVLPTPTPTADTCAPALTQIAYLDATLAPIETLVNEVVPTCAAMWDDCYASKTTTPELTATPVYPTPQPTYTPYPTPTLAPVLCRRCIDGMPLPYNCPGGYFCKRCSECRWLCVSVTSPNADCNYCLSLVIP